MHWSCHCAFTYFRCMAGYDTCINVFSGCMILLMLFTSPWLRYVQSRCLQSLVRESALNWCCWMEAAKWRLTLTSCPKGQLIGCQDTQDQVALFLVCRKSVNPLLIMHRDIGGWQSNWLQRKVAARTLLCRWKHNSKMIVVINKQKSCHYDAFCALQHPSLLQINQESPLVRQTLLRTLPDHQTCCRS